MTFTAASPLSVISFLLIVLFVVGAFIYGIHRSSLNLGYSSAKRTWPFALIFLIWLGICAVVVEGGYLHDMPEVRIPLFFAVINAVAVIFAFSPLGKQLSLGLPLSFLVLFQAFRLPLELVLHSWADQWVIPHTMTWTGSNWDILSGLIAIIVLPLIDRWKQAAWVANILGFVLLLNVMRVAMMSSPLPFAWNVHPPLQLILYSPYFLIAPVCVAGALAGHIILTMSLIKKK